MQDWYITIFIACVIATYASRYCVINYKYEGENTEKNKVSQIIQEIKLNVQNGIEKGHIPQKEPV